MKPIPKSGSCSRIVDGETVKAPLCVVGVEPDRDGGGILYWAWSLEEAGEAADAFRENGFHEVKVMNGRTERTYQKALELVFRTFGNENFQE